MSSSDKSCLVASAMFDCAYEVASYLLVVRCRSVSLALVVECLVFVDLTEFDAVRVLPLGVSVGLVNFHCLVKVPWYLESIHVDRLGAERVQFSLIDRAKKTLLGLGLLLESWKLPSRGVEQLVLVCVDCDCDWISIADASLVPVGC